MKTLRMWLAVLIAAVVLLAAFLVAPFGVRPAPPSRFAALAPGGSSSSIDRSARGAIDAPQSSSPIVATAIKNDASQPLRAIVPIYPQRGGADLDVNLLLPLPGREPGAPNRNVPADFRDPVRQSGPILPAVPAPIQNFEGVNNVNAVLPPDTNGDVGPYHYIQWVNLSFAVYDKTGVKRYGPANGNTLWSGFGGACQSYNHGDPIVLYDHLADRWLMSQFAVPGGVQGYHQCIAVSQTGDPLGAWYRYDFLISATKLNDYPHFGVWPDGYYLSINQFTLPVTWAGAGAAVFEREQMLSGQPARMVLFDLFDSDPGAGGMLPADLDGPPPPPGTPNVFAEADDDGFGFPQDQIRLWEFAVDWADPASSTFTEITALPTAAFDSDLCAGSRSCIPQPGTPVGLDAIADRIMHRLQYRHFGAHQTLVLNHTVDVDNTNHAGVRWYELRDAGSGWSIHQQSTFAPDALHRWMGSLAMDGGGNLALGYSISSGAISPSIRYTGRLAGDALGALTLGEGIVITGTGSQTHPQSRWGDYSMLGVDPLDDCTFWYTNEYLTPGTASWRTRVAAFTLAGCPPTPAPGFITGTVYNSATLASIGGAPILAVNQTATLIHSAMTGPSGVFTLTAQPGTYSVTAGPLYGYPVPRSAVIAVTTGVTSGLGIGLGGVPILSGVATSISDAAPGGNGNGYAEPGETAIRLFRGILNAGTLTATNVSAGIAVLTPGVTVVTPTASYGSIAAGSVVTHVTPFGFSIHPGVLCGTTLDFTHWITSDQVVYSSTFSLPASILGGGAPITYTSVDVPKAIPDNNLVTGASSIVNVGDAYLTDDVNAQVHISHTWAADLDIYLVHPTSAQVELSTDNGGSSDHYAGTLFDDEAAASITSGFAPFTGSYRPEGLLSTFDATDAQGAWTLRLFDDDSLFTGTLNGWSLIVRPARCDFDTSRAEANFAPSAFSESLPAGAIVTRAFAVSNTGTLTLNWTLSESPAAPWLGLSATGGSIRPAGRADGVLSFTAPLVGGAYTTTLQFASNDADNPLIAVPVTLTVNLRTYLPLVLKNQP